MTFRMGGLEVRWKGGRLPYSAFDKLQRRQSHAAVVENKRPGRDPGLDQEQQDRQPRFNRVPDGPRRSSQKPGMLKNRALQIVEPPIEVESSPREPAPLRWWSPRPPAHAPSEAAK